MYGVVKLSLIGLTLILLGFCGWWYSLTPQPTSYSARMIYLRDTFMFHTRNLQQLPTMTKRVIGGDPPSEQEVRFWLPSADAGNTVAQIYVSQYFFAMGAQNPMAYERAIAYLKPAAELGIPIAQNALGVAYLYGYGVPQQDEKAYYWFYQAATRGLDLAQTNLMSLTRRLSPEQVKQLNAKQITTK